MTNEELMTTTAVNNWKLVVSRFSKGIAPLTDDQLQQEVAPGRNRLFYLVGHLTAVHDRMFALLGIGERLHPELDEAFITSPDKTHPDPLSAGELKQLWTDVNAKLTAAFEKLTPQEWLYKHTSVSDEDFANDPTRNRLAILLSRTGHAAFHTGQAILVKP
jgi:DinB superfamily